MYNEFPLDIDPKQDSPKRLALLLGVPKYYFTSAIEFNKIIAGLTELYTIQANLGLTITSFEELVGGDVRITLSDGQSFVVAATVDNSVPKVVIIDGWLVWKTQGIDPTIIENLDKIQGQRDATRFGTYEVLDATDLTIEANLRTITEDNTL